MVFAASNKQLYYGINATTGEVLWTFDDPTAEEFIICSPVYNDGQVFLIDGFTIVSVNATNGQELWGSFLGSELYVSPTYGEGKLYVTADERAMYVVNATDGAKISYYPMDSNSWSAPTLYEGKLYVGNNDWKVYCFSQYLPLNSSLTLDVADANAVIGDSINGSGQLYPEIPNETITLSFVKPNGVIENMAMTTNEMGLFNFTYRPNVIGEYTVTANWKPTVGYYSSTYSENQTLDIVAAPTPTPSPTPVASSTASSYPSPTAGPFGLPMGYFYALAATLAIAVIFMSIIVYVKRIKR
jgi:hypothetical protein